MAQGESELVFPSFFELYEALDYQAKKGTPLYNFQTKHFRLDSNNRNTFRDLEALLFGGFEADTLNKLDLDAERLASKIKFRSSVLSRLINKVDGCNTILAN